MHACPLGPVPCLCLAIHGGGNAISNGDDNKQEGEGTEARDCREIGHPMYYKVRLSLSTSARPGHSSSAIASRVTFR